MSLHPVQLGLRLILEMAGLAIFAYWGWAQGMGVLRWVYALGLMLLVAVVWGGTAIQDDPTRSGRAYLRIPGVARLLIELGYFGVAAWVLLDTGRTRLAVAMGAVVVLHYSLSYDRVGWLLRQ